jgi:hypothetical protein
MCRPTPEAGEVSTPADAVQGTGRDEVKEVLLSKDVACVAVKTSKVTLLPAYARSQDQVPFPEHINEEDLDL